MSSFATAATSSWCCSIPSLSPKPPKRWCSGFAKSRGQLCHREDHAAGRRPGQSVLGDGTQSADGSRCRRRPDVPHSCSTFKAHETISISAIQVAVAACHQRIGVAMLDCCHGDVVGDVYPVHPVDLGAGPSCRAHGSPPAGRPVGAVAAFPARPRGLRAMVRNGSTDVVQQPDWKPTTSGCSRSVSDARRSTGSVHMLPSMPRITEPPRTLRRPTTSRCAPFSRPHARAAPRSSTTPRAARRS